MFQTQTAASRSWNGAVSRNSRSLAPCASPRRRTFTHARLLLFFNARTNETGGRRYAHLSGVTASVFEARREGSERPEHPGTLLEFVATVRDADDEANAAQRLALFAETLLPLIFIIPN